MLGDLRPHFADFGDVVGVVRQDVFVPAGVPDFRDHGAIDVALAAQAQDLAEAVLRDEFARAFPGGHRVEHLGRPRPRMERPPVRDGDVEDDGPLPEPPEIEAKDVVADENGARDGLIECVGFLEESGNQRLLDLDVPAVRAGSMRADDFAVALRPADGGQATETAVEAGFADRFEDGGRPLVLDPRSDRLGLLHGGGRRDAGGDVGDQGLVEGGERLDVPKNFVVDHAAALSSTTASYLASVTRRFRTVEIVRPRRRAISAVGNPDIDSARRSSS